jgi:hypothetical protein
VLGRDRRQQRSDGAGAHRVHQASVRRVGGTLLPSRWMFAGAVFIGS